MALINFLHLLRTTASFLFSCGYDSLFPQPHFKQYI